MGVEAWTVAQAKTKLSEVIDKGRDPWGRKPLLGTDARPPWWLPLRNGSARPGARGTWLSSLRRRHCGGTD